MVSDAPDAVTIGRNPVVRKAKVKRKAQVAIKRQMCLVPQS